MTFFISDTHFGHFNIIKHCGRPFESVEEMDRTIIDAWNSKVSNNDKIYILGDMFYRCPEDYVRSVLEELKGKKTLIVGNHDHWWTKHINLGDYFEDVEMMVKINTGKEVAVLCHYPLLSWEKDSKTYMIYGHIHNNTNMDFWPLILKRERMLNAGVEINNFVPVTIDEMITNNLSFKENYINNAQNNILVGVSN